jgi:hypothetical protein
MPYHKKTKLRTVRRKNQRKVTRRRKGGVNNGNLNNEFEDRRGDLVNQSQDIIDELQNEIRSILQQINETNYIDRLQNLLDEAEEIDQHFGGHEMEDMINQRLQDIHHILGLYNPNPQPMAQPMIPNNNNNNSTVTLGNNMNMNMNNNNNKSVISVYRAGKKNNKLRK